MFHLVLKNIHLVFCLSVVMQLVLMLIYVIKVWSHHSSMIRSSEPWISCSTTAQNNRCFSIWPLQLLISLCRWDEWWSWWRHQRKHFPHNWPFVRGIHRWPVDSPHKGQWRGALTFSFICTWTNGWANNRDAGDLRRHCNVTACPYKG